VSVTPGGGFLIADTANQRVRRVAADGRITTIAGSGAGGFAGDGGPATAARLQQPFGATVAADGSVLIADTTNSRVPRVGLDGVITTVAGRASFGGAGDGGPATAASLDTLSDVIPAPEGAFVIADGGTDRLRRVAADGRITTLAGISEGGAVAGSGGPATLVRLDNPNYLALSADGGLLVTETFGHRVRYVDAGLRGAEPAPVATVDTKLRARAKASVSLRYVATRPALAQVELRRGKLLAAKTAASTRPGRNAVKLRVPGTPGTYRVVLTVRTVDGQRATDTATLTVTKPRRKARG